MTSTFARPRSAARASMNRFCVRELDTAVIREVGEAGSAIHSVSEPHPQPSSRISFAVAQTARPLAGQPPACRLLPRPASSTPVREMAGRVLEVLAEHELEEFAGQFVVLLVRLARGDGNRTAVAVPRTNCIRCALLRLHIAPVLVAKALPRAAGVCRTGSRQSGSRSRSSSE